MKLTEELKNKICDALESGEYRQGRGELQQNIDGTVCYCCLGVARVVAGIETKSRFAIVDDLGNYILFSNPVQSNLIARNDGDASAKKHSFAEIAEYLRSVPAELLASEYEKR